MRKHNQVLIPNQGLDEFTKVCIQANGVAAQTLSASYNWSQIAGFSGLLTMTSLDITNNGKYVWVTYSDGSTKSAVSRDYGQSFQQLDASKYANVIVAKNSGTAFSYGNGFLYVSNDGGYNWQKLNTPIGFDTSCTVTNVSDDGKMIILSATYQTNLHPIYLSSDYGQTFTDITSAVRAPVTSINGQPAGGIFLNAMNSTGKHIIVVVGRGYGGGGSAVAAVAISHDYGTTWSASNPSAPSSLWMWWNGFSPWSRNAAIDDSGNIIVLGGQTISFFDGNGQQNSNQPLFVSQDSGVTWFTTDPFSVVGGYNGFLTNRNNNIFVRTTGALSGLIATSTTSGSTWSSINAPVNLYGTGSGNGTATWSIMTNLESNVSSGYGIIEGFGPNPSGIIAHYSLSYTTSSSVYDSSIYGRTLSGNSEMIVLNNSSDAKFNQKTVLLGDVNTTSNHFANGYISIPYSTDLGLSYDSRTSATTDNFCIETWFKPAPSLSAISGSFFNQYVTSGSYVNWGLTNNVMSFKIVDTSITKCNYSTSYTPTTGVWDHLAVKRNSDGITFYKNDTALSSTVTIPLLSSYVIPTFNSPTVIGQDPLQFPGFNVLYGYINDYRISIGTSRNNYPISHNRPYINNNLYDKTGIDTYTKIYFSGDKLIDESYYKNPVVISNTYLSGDAPIVENCFGYNGDSVYVATPTPSVSGLSGMNPLAQDFAVNFWFKDGPLYGNQDINLCGHDTNYAGFQIIYNSWQTGAGAPFLKIVGQSIDGSYGNLFNVRSPNLSFNQGQWNHVAFVRDTANTNFNLYCNGSLVKQVSGISTSIKVSNGVNFYTAGPSCYGQVALLQYDVGTTRGWTGSTITIPSTTDLSRIDSYTKLFYKGDSFADLSQYNRTITSMSLSAQMMNAQAPKFSNKIITLPDANGGYPGITVTPPNNIGFGIGQQDFAVDFWFKTITAYSKQWLITSYSGLSIALDICDTNAVGTFGSIGMMASSNGSTWNLTTGSGATFAFKANVWNHVAYTRNGTLLNLYLNGVLYRSVSIAANSSIYYTNNQKFLIGGDYVNYNLKGQISQLRYCVGTNRGWVGSSITVPVKPASPLGYPIDSKTSICINGESRAIEDADQSMYKRTVTII